MLENLVGPGGFEPPTSTMSRPIGRTKTRVDALKLKDESARGKRLRAELPLIRSVDCRQSVCSGVVALPSQVIAGQRAPENTV